MTRVAGRLSALILLLLIICRAPGFAQPGPKRIYIALDDHTDYLWAGDEATYRQVFLNTLDYYLNLADSTANNPSPYQSRWNTDGSFWMWTYEKNRSPQQFQRLVDRVRSGHITVPLNALVTDEGGTPAEAVLRGFYYPGLIQRRYGLNFPIAVSMEDHTLPYGLVSLWTGAGAKYSWKGVCGCGGPTPAPGDREHQIYWWTGPDGSRVLMKWYSLFSHDSIGGYAEARDPVNAINIVDTNSTFLARYPFRVIGAFGKGHDDLQTLTDEFVTVAQQQSNANRQIIVSNQLDFFQDFESTYGGGQLPSVSCSFGNDGALHPASMSETTGAVKRSLEKLRGAESLATLVSVQNPGFMDGRKDARELAWMNFGLFWEHAWTADTFIGRRDRANWQRRIAGEIASYINTLHADASTALGGMIRRSGSNQRFYAFNPLNWTRTDYADLQFADTNPVHVVDLSTGQETPSQIVFIESVRYLRVLARDIPSVGYKVFEIRPGAGAAFAAAASVSGGAIEHDIYRLNVASRGAITSILDKRRGSREFAGNLNGRAVNDLGAGSGALQIENAGPVSVTLRADSSGPLNHTTRVTLFRDSERIDIRNDINQNFGDTRTWGFSFNLSAPDVWHEEVGAVIRGKRQSQGGHYSDRAQNTRYDWQTLNHFADMAGGDGAGVTLSNADLYFMKLGASTVSTLDTSTPQISVLAGGQEGAPGLGILNQGGETHFLQRFALRTHGGYNSTSAMRFSLEHQNPLVVGTVTGGAAYPETSYSLVQISDPNVFLWALKPAEEGIGAGIIARVWNVADSASNFSLALANPLLGAKRATHVETDTGDATVTNGVLNTSAAARQLQTYRLFMGAPPPPPAPTPTPTPTPNPIDDTQTFVRQHYLDFLNRPADANGLNFWSEQIEQCGADQPCREVRRINVSAAFYLSIEFQETGYFVYRMYKAAYGDMTGAPVPLRREEFLPDTQAVGQGVEVGVGVWRQQLEANKNAFAAQFVTPARFTSLYPVGMSAAAFVDALFNRAGVTPTAAERQAAINVFGGGDAAGRAAALRSVAESQTVRDTEFRKAFVLMQYFGYLRRNPNEGQDTNFDGYFLWLNKLNQFNGNFVDAEMVKAFISSIEYRRRFAP